MSMALSRSGRRMLSTNCRPSTLGCWRRYQLSAFLTSQTGAVDAALLACAHADGLTVLHIADGVGLGVFRVMRATIMSILAASGSSLFSETMLVSISLSITRLLRPCSKVTPNTSLCSTARGRSPR